MSKEIFWGLTERDFEKGMWNTLHETAVVFAGFAAAAVANRLVFGFLQSKNPGKHADNKTISFLVGAVAGIGGGLYAANQLTHVTFAGEKALKFLVISFVIGASGRLLGRVGTLIGLIASGGAWGYFGRTPLYVFGWAGGIATSYYLYQTS